MSLDTTGHLTDSVDHHSLDERHFIRNYFASLDGDAKDYLDTVTKQINISEKFKQSKYIVNIPVHYKDHAILNTLDIYAEQSFSNPEDYSQLKIVLAVTGSKDDLIDPQERQEKTLLLSLIKDKIALLKQKRPLLDIFLVDYEYDFSEEKKKGKNPSINTNMGRIRSDLANLSLRILSEGCDEVSLKKTFIVCADADLVYMGREKLGKQQKGFFDRMNKVLPEDVHVFAGGFVFPESDYAHNELIRYKDRFVDICRLLKHARLDPSLCYFSEANSLFSMDMYFAVGGYHRKHSLKSESKILVSKIYRYLREQVSQSGENMTEDQIKKLVKQKMKYIFGNVTITTNGRRPKVAFAVHGTDVGIYDHFEVYAKGKDASAHYIGNPEKVHIPEVQMNSSDPNFEGALTQSIVAWIQYELLNSRNSEKCLYDGKKYEDLLGNKRRLGNGINEQYDAIVSLLLQNSEYIRGLLDHQSKVEEGTINYNLGSFSYEDDGFLRFLNSQNILSHKTTRRYDWSNYSFVAKQLSLDCWSDEMLMKAVENYNLRMRKNYTTQQARNMLNLLLETHLFRMKKSLSPIWKKVIKSALFFTGLSLGFDENKELKVRIK